MLTFPLLEGLLKLPRFGRPLFCTHLFSTFSQTKGPPDPKSPLFVSPLYQFFEDGVPVPDANSEKFHTFVAILNEADMLTKDAQHALRRTMEKYMTNLRIILFSSNLGKIIEPLQSRCVLVRVPAPEDEQVFLSHYACL
ncbi:DNA clamp loader [Mitosporidium daphniae]|uniref:DNA clamp loader n=1 Tax=Mitosporidium daphniae TaxID=1485682 RepID=A0A098VZB6_9MICR|nr:DNA clamp loader [Mitosporidium daphniae]KGG53096.1 DNA clamp loader [Mitosporidium daphniae]|eukprot:XP_013239532.1 DNA clamp loader [Mitosporidium daphniae]